MNKKQLALLQAARISVATWEKASKDDVTEEDFKSEIEDYTNTQLQYWKDKHPDFTPEKLKEKEKEFFDEGVKKGLDQGIRRIVRGWDFDDEEFRGKTPEEVSALALAKLTKSNSPDEAKKMADEYKTKALTLEEQLRKINEEVIPGIHNEYKTKESESKRMEELIKPFSKLPVLDEFREDYHDILLKKISKTGIEAKLNDKGQIEYYDKDGTKAKNQKTGKDLTTEDFVEMVKPNLKGYLKESNGEPNDPKPTPAGTPPKSSEAKQKILERNKQLREATLAGAK